MERIHRKKKLLAGILSVLRILPFAGYAPLERWGKDGNRDLTGGLNRVFYIYSLNGKRLLLTKASLLRTATIPAESNLA